VARQAAKLGADGVGATAPDGGREPRIAGDARELVARALAVALVDRAGAAEALRDGRVGLPVLAVRRDAEEDKRHREHRDDHDDHEEQKEAPAEAHARSMSVYPKRPIPAPVGGFFAGSTYVQAGRF
jgi:hypothetical protein